MAQTIPSLVPLADAEGVTLEQQYSMTPLGVDGG
jgi:hypothetical protein